MSIFTNPASASADQAAEYIRAILDLLGDADPMDVLVGTASALRQFVAETPMAALCIEEAPGKWDARSVLRHLADSELVWGWRLRLVLAQDRPRISGYDQDAWAERLHYADSDPDESLQLFEVLRRANLRLLARAAPAELERVGEHEERGAESVVHMMRLYAGHDLLHLRQLARIRNAVTAR